MRMLFDMEVPISEQGWQSEYISHSVGVSVSVDGQAQFERC